MSFGNRTSMVLKEHAFVELTKSYMKLNEIELSRKREGNMKTGLLIIGILMFTMSSRAQDLNAYASATDEHVLIRGTNISMIPPDAYELSDEFKGFQNPEDQTSMIIVMEIPQSYFEVSMSFSKEMLVEQGMVLTTKDEVKVNGFDGDLIELIQMANGLTFAKLILLYGDSMTTTMINGVYIKDSTQTGEKIIECVKSTVVNTHMVLDPRGDLDYNLTETQGNLQFHSVVGNAMLFSRDGVIPTESPERIILATDKVYEKTQIADRKEFCVARVKTYPYEFQIMTDRGVNEIELDGLKGYELYALKGTDQEKEMYQAIVFNDSGGYYVFVGTYLTGDENAERDILGVISTFKRD